MPQVVATPANVQTGTYQASVYGDTPNVQDDLPF
jgi:hypothetical protein